MEIRDRKTSFKSGIFYNVTAQIQENTVLNRGILDLGGLGIPQIVMSNNKDERIERGMYTLFYMASWAAAPFLMLPAFNKFFLSRNGIVKTFNNNERRIVEVSKKYLTKGGNHLLAGIRERAIEFEQEALKQGKSSTIRQDFENVINRFPNPDELKQKLIKTHEGILFADFISTSLMWCAVPWIVTETTKLRTKRSGFSATYSMIDEGKSKLNAQQHEKQKKKKLLCSTLLAIVPAILFPKLLTKGTNSNGGILGLIKQNIHHFEYNKGRFPSKSIFAAIWLLSDYPSQIISSRDKYERRDRAVRGAATIAVFFGGDFLLNNVFGRISDKLFGTQIMNRKGIDKNSNFIKKMLMTPKTFVEIENLEHIKTKNAGAALYWVSLFANMAILGFAVPNFLNTILKRDITKEKTVKNSK